MPFEDFVVVAFLFAFVCLGRKELENLIERQMDNFQVVKANPLCSILYDVIVNCDYKKYNYGL